MENDTLVLGEEPPPPQTGLESQKEVTPVEDCAEKAWKETLQGTPWAITLDSHLF